MEDTRREERMDDSFRWRKKGERDEEGGIPGPPRRKRHNRDLGVHHMIVVVKVVVE